MKTLVPYINGQLVMLAVALAAAVYLAHVGEWNVAALFVGIAAFALWLDSEKNPVFENPDEEEEYPRWR